MAIAKEFEYYTPNSVKQAVELKTRYGTRGAFLAGGTDLIVNLHDGLVEADAVIDLKGIKALKELTYTKDGLNIGALVTYSDLLASATVKKNYPLLWEAAHNVASGPVRNRATMAGNLCSCVPCLDSGPPTVLYEAVFTIAGPDGLREEKIFDFLRGPRRTSLKKDEMVVSILLPKINTKKGECFIKLKRYKGEDLAQASVGVIALARNRYRVAFGSVGPVPNRAEKIEKLLNGKRLNANQISRAKRLVDSEISPITDVRSSKEYRLHMSKVMLGRALEAAVARLSGKGPKTGTELI